MGCKTEGSALTYIRLAPGPAKCPVRAQKSLVYESILTQAEPV